MQIEIPDRIGWVLAEHAKTAGVDVADVVSVILSSSLKGLTTGRLPVKAQIARLVHEGKCDADIAEALHGTVGWVSGVRRDMGLKPNPRYRHAVANSD